MWHQICELNKLSRNSGAGAFVGGKQVAVFYLPSQTPEVMAIDNWDPIGQAFVMSRGIVGDVAGQPCVASPLYKQHYNLQTGQCFESPEVKIKTWAVKVEQGKVWIEA